MTAVYCQFEHCVFGGFSQKLYSANMTHTKCSYCFWTLACSGLCRFMKPHPQEVLANNAKDKHSVHARLHLTVVAKRTEIVSVFGVVFSILIVL